MKDPIISASHLTRAFQSGEKTILAVNNVHLEVFPNELLAISGRSGSGKTTLLNLIAGLDKPTSGKVLFEGRDLHRIPESDLLEIRRNKIGFVFQSFGLLPLLSAYENVELALHVAGIPRRERKSRVLESLDSVGLASRIRHRPFELSGGEQQRVSIARALVTNPTIIFADEPTAELDFLNAKSITMILQNICMGNGVTVIVATHDDILASRANRIVEMIDGAVVGQSLQRIPKS